MAPPVLFRHGAKCHALDLSHFRQSVIHTVSTPVFEGISSSHIIFSPYTSTYTSVQLRQDLHLFVCLQPHLFCFALGRSTLLVARCTSVLGFLDTEWVWTFRTLAPLRHCLFFGGFLCRSFSQSLTAARPLQALFFHLQNGEGCTYYPLHNLPRRTYFLLIRSLVPVRELCGHLHGQPRHLQRSVEFGPEAPHYRRLERTDACLCHLEEAA